MRVEAALPEDRGAAPEVEAPSQAGQADQARQVPQSFRSASRPTPGGDQVSSPAALPGASRPVTVFLRRLLRFFFHRIEVAGVDNVPRDRGGVLIAWHPNGLLDPGLILAHFPRRVVFGARHGLLHWPLLGWFLRKIGTVPIYRPQDLGGPRDEEARRAANRRSLDALASEVAAGSFAALFPEGDSHDEPHLLDLRPGAARLLLRARELTPEGAPPPVLLPVGLHYDRKNLFGSTALVEFHPPVDLPDELIEPSAPEAVDAVDAPDEAGAVDAVDAGLRARVGGLTRLIRTVLVEVVQATESWETHHLMHRLRKLMRAERAARAGARPGPPSLRERVLGLARVWHGYLTCRASRPEETARLEARVRRYHAVLEGLGLHDHELDVEADLVSPWRLAVLLAQAVVVYLLLPPLLVLGYLVNTPIALALGVAGRRLGARVKDEATIKLLLGASVFPLTWLALSLLVGWGVINLHGIYPQIPDRPWLAGTVTFLLCSVGGWLAVRYARIAAETYRALHVRLTRARRRRFVERLARERAALFEAATALSDGLDLPGAVAPDGRIVADSQ